MLGCGTLTPTQHLYTIYLELDMYTARTTGSWFSPMATYVGHFVYYLSMCTTETWMRLHSLSGRSIYRSFLLSLHLR